MNESCHKSAEMAITGDGTPTLMVPEYSEAMHSSSGAYEEALLKHVKPSRVLELESGSISVLDIGFGIGYNLLALLFEASLSPLKKKLRIISCEFERTYHQHMKTIRFNDRRDEQYAKLAKLYADGYYCDGQIDAVMLFGDARNHALSFSGMDFDAVFHDPFSPSKNPELWSVEFFKAIRRGINEHGILTTYSSAFQARGAMIEAGFRIAGGPSVGGKREGTLASVFGKLDYFCNDEISKIVLNPKSVPYRDMGLSCTREEIREHRKTEMKERKALKQVI
jgi:tRNA U34 5-methylaminomethyl-2-thiouridine-forming methyltransferase MnmC